MRVDLQSFARSTGELRAGTDVTVVRTDGEWAWVQSDAGEQGWINL